MAWKRRDPPCEFLKEFTQPLISGLIIPRRSTSTDEKSAAEMEISCRVRELLFYLSHRC